MSKNNPMQKTLKLGNKLPVKSRAVRCQECDRLVRIEKLPPDEDKTSVQYMTCYDCMKEAKTPKKESGKKVSIKDFFKKKDVVMKPMNVRCKRCQKNVEVPYENYAPGRIYLCAGCQSHIEARAALRRGAL